MKRHIKIFEEFINESPDVIYNMTQRMDDYHASDALPFGYYKDRMFVGSFGTDHSTLEDTMNRLKSANLDDQFFQKNWKTSEDIFRKKLKFSGRLWLHSNIISFWEYPQPNEMKRIISDLNAALKEVGVNKKITNNWLIDIPVLMRGGNEFSGKTVSVDEYINKNMTPREMSGVRSWEELYYRYKEFKS